MEMKYKTIEELESDFWSPIKGGMTPMITRIYELRKTPIGEFESEDYRLLISQNIGLDFLVPLAIEILNVNILEDSIYYPGDLLVAVLTLDSEYWIGHTNEKKKLFDLLSNSEVLIKKSTEINQEIKNNIVEAVCKFKNNCTS